MELKPIFSNDRDEYLAHYGILGMKWGVRNAETQRKYAGKKSRFRNSDGSLSEKGRKRQKRRDDFIDTTNRDIKQREAAKAEAQKVLDDIDKKGAKSKYVKDLYKYDPNFQESLIDIQDKGRDLWDDGRGEQRPLSSLTKGAQKEIVRRARKDYSWNANYDSTKDRKIIENVKNTPINKRSYAEVASRESSIRKGSAIAGAVLPVAGSIALGTLNGSSPAQIAGHAAVTALFVSPGTALGGYLAAPDLSNKYYNKHIKNA